MKKVAVVGAGASGLPAIKWCKQEGFDVVCLERTDHIGGLWYYTPVVHEDQACVMKTTVINTSKEMMCYSDFPIPKDFPNFMHNTKVLQYFNMYAQQFNLEEAIRFKTEVLSIKKASDFAETGKWDLEIKDLATGKVSKETYDAVLVCTGHHASKNIPDFRGMKDFKGKIVHTHDYKDYIGYENKRVVVVGIGNSGGDVAVELGRISKQVYLSTRKGSWIFNRVGDKGMPFDVSINSRKSAWLLGTLPFTWVNNHYEGVLNQRFDHAEYGLKPKHRPFSQHPSVNDDLPNRVICGSVIVKPNIKRFTETGVEFDDGTFEDNIDAVILATGYTFGFPFIDKEELEVRENCVELFKYVFPPDLEHPTLAVVGCIQPLGAIMPISEMHCRWATGLWKERSKLPSKDEMWADIRDKRAKMAERYVHSTRHTIQVDYVPYMDELAEQIGCKPNLTALFLRDPVLAWTCFFGPCTPYQYRLTGPHPWSGAREAVLTTWDRIKAPFKTRKVDEGDQSTEMSILPLAILTLFLCLLIAYLSSMY